MDTPSSSENAIQQKKRRKPTVPQQIDIRISAPSLRGCDGTVQVLSQFYKFDKRSLPYPYTCEDGTIQYTVYVSISRYKRNA